MSEPITLHDAILQLASEIAMNENLTVSERVRWLDMLVLVSTLSGREVIGALQVMSDAMSAAMPDATTVDDEELGDDFGDDDLND